MAIKIGKLLGTDKLIGTDDEDLLIALGAKTTLDGGAGNDILLGGLNDDILIGGKGADILSGGLGTDTADYSKSDAAVTVNLTTGKGTGGDAQGDTLISIENVIGSAFADVLTGDKGNNVLSGGDGDDIFVVTKGKDVITDFTPGTVGTPSTEVLIDFQGLGATGGEFVPNGYKDFNWSNLRTNDFRLTGVGGYDVGDSVGDIGAFTVNGFSTGKMSSTAGDFDLASLQISRGSSGPLVARIEAYDDGERVGYVDIQADGLATVDFELASTTGASGTPTFSGRFTSVDELWFVTTRQPTPIFDNFSFNIALDDIKISYPGTIGGGGDTIDVPDGTSIAALVTSAVSNGKGGTILTHAQGTLELLGIAPGSVSADWFV